MNTRIFAAFSLFFSLSFLSVPAHAQCRDKRDQFCRNLQYILYAAQTDFGAFIGPQEFYDFGLFRKGHSSEHASKLPNPDVSFAGAKLTCKTTAWMSGASVYICEGQASIPDAEQWYTKTLSELQQLQYRWHFTVQSPGVDHVVDAGPVNCEIPATDGEYIVEGPYAGDCPLHIQTIRQSDGTDEMHLWLTSYTSPLLARRTSAPAKAQFTAIAQAPQSSPSSSSVSASGPSTSAQATDASSASQTSAAASHATCDELCQGLKKILEERWTAFKEPNGSVSGTQTASSDLPAKLPGAASCSLHSGPTPAERASASNHLPASHVHVAAVSLRDGKSASSGSGSHAAPSATPAQYVCYWPEASASAAEAQFHDLLALLQVLIPTTWTAQQRTEPDENTGIDVTVWSARDATDKNAVGLYLSGQSVGLHVSASQ